MLCQWEYQKMCQKMCQKEYRNLPERIPEETTKECLSDIPVSEAMSEWGIICQKLYQQRGPIECKQVCAK